MKVIPLGAAKVQIIMTTATVILRYLKRMMSVRKLELCWQHLPGVHSRVYTSTVYFPHSIQCVVCCVVCERCKHQTVRRNHILLE